MSRSAGFTTGAYGAVATAITVTLIRPANRARSTLLIANDDAAIKMYYGFNASVTTANGIPLAFGQSREFVFYTGPVYVIAASGTPSCRYEEC